MKTKRHESFQLTQAFALHDSANKVPPKPICGFHVGIYCLVSQRRFSDLLDNTLHSSCMNFIYEKEH